MSSDRIEKQIVLRAPRSRVWRALTNHEEFGTWFRAKLDSAFVVGQRVTGQITYPGYEHLKFQAIVERMEPEELFSFRWHPGADAARTDQSSEPMTLVEFRLAETAEGTLLKVVESGFDKLPPERREQAFRENQEGWSIQMDNVKQHVGG